MIPTSSTHTVSPRSTNRAPDRRSDDELVGACLAQDPTAWPELIERHGRLVFSIAIQHGFDTSDAEDVFQDVFAALLRRLPTIRNRQGLAKWLITTTRFVCLQHRAKHRLPLDIDLSHIEVVDGDPADLEQREREQHVHSALRRLGGRCEELLRVLYDARTSTSYEQIAALFDIPVGSIGPTRARCLAKLLAILDEADDESEAR